MSLINQTAKQIARAINAHCDKGNGIYVRLNVSAGSLRYFGATVIGDARLGHPAAAFITPDFGETWVRVPMDATFSDGNWNAPISGLPTSR